MGLARRATRRSSCNPHAPFGFRPGGDICCVGAPRRCAPTSPASRRLASAPARPGTRLLLILGQTPRCPQALMLAQRGQAERCFEGSVPKHLSTCPRCANIKACLILGVVGRSEGAAFLAWRGQMQGGATQAMSGATSSRSANAADVPARPEPEGRMGLATTIAALLAVQAPCARPILILGQTPKPAFLTGFRSEAAQTGMDTPLR